jgi:hydroxypyruvate isomerase
MGLQNAASERVPSGAGRLPGAYGATMPRFAANLSFLFLEYPFLERFDRAGAVGFEGVEYMSPYDEDLDAIKDALTRNGLKQALFNLPPGNWAAGERGIASHPDRTPEFKEGVAKALEIASALDCRRINCLPGLALPQVEPDRQWSTLVENVQFAANEAMKAGVSLVVEPINTFDIPGFFLSTPTDGFRLLEEVAHPNASLQYDVYHAQRMEGNVVATIQQEIARIGHVQIADSPKRNEPGTGELHYPFILKALDDAGYRGWIGLEYRPSTTTEESFGWLEEWHLWPSARGK